LGRHSQNRREVSKGLQAVGYGKLWPPASSRNGSPPVGIRLCDGGDSVLREQACQSAAPARLMAACCNIVLKGAIETARDAASLKRGTKANHTQRSWLFQTKRPDDQNCD